MKNFNIITTFLIILLTTFFTVNSNAGALLKHPPYASGKCLNCHKKDANGAPIKNEFVANQPDLCYKCHDRVDENSVIHPALKSKCTNCHSPHESTNPSLLKKNYNDTCTKCHDAPNADLPIQHSALIMAKSCVRCHEPHSSSRKNLLKDRTAILCAYCHTDIGKGLMDQNNTNHPAAIMGCQNCHDPHGSDNEKLLKSATINELCFKCHDKAGFNGGHPRPGHPISGIPDPLYPNKELSCISCHKPHYSPNEKLLRYNFMKAPYDKTICSVCHWQVLLPPPGPPRPPWND